MNDIDRLFAEYQSADRKDKPGIARALDVLAGFAYVEDTNALAEVVKSSLIRWHGVDTTADLSLCIARDIINSQRGI